jgi:hypothetical protein
MLSCSGKSTEIAIFSALVPDGGPQSKRKKIANGKKNH